jgi:hypothetical protein
MATKVYVWVHPDGFSPGHPGHCAIKVSGTYISFHPGANDGFKANAAQYLPAPVAKVKMGISARTSRMYSYEEDCVYIGRKPEHKIKLVGLAEESSIDAVRLKQVFQGFKYSFAGRPIHGNAFNCVEATMMCLDLLTGSRLEGYNPIIPEDVASYAYALKKYFDN